MPPVAEHQDQDPDPGLDPSKYDLPLGATYQDAEIVESEPIPLVVDGTRAAPDFKRTFDLFAKKEPPPPTRLPAYKPDDAREIWAVAKSHLDRILKNDKSREEVLLEVIQYCQTRLKSNK